MGPYWANTSSNSLVGKLIREGEPELKIQMESLLQGKSIHTVLDEQIVYNQLDGEGGSSLEPSSCRTVSNAFLKALLTGDIRAMNRYMNKIALQIFSYFDTGNKPSEEEPERFYHGFALGLMVELSDRYVLTSNRESGFGRYDVMLEPKSQEDPGIILEFKVQDPDHEAELSDTVAAALKQIEEKKVLIGSGRNEKRR